MSGAERMPPAGGPAAGAEGQVGETFPFDSINMALTLASRGFPVLPLCWPTFGPDGPRCGCGGRHEGRDIGKAPVGRLVPHGHHDATTDPATLRRWWSACPQANVGVALGPAGLVAVDCDTPAGLEEALRRGLPATLVRVGRLPAYIYRRPDGVPAVRRDAAPGLQLLADGYLVVWGRHREGHDVRLEPWPGDPAPAPEWVLDVLVQAGRPAPAPRPEGADREPPVRLSGRDLELWRGELVAVRGEDRLRPRTEVPADLVDRSRTLFILGLALARAGASEAAVAEALAERDAALGFAKYSDRRDSEVRYDEIAQKVLAAAGEADGAGNGQSGRRSAASILVGLAEAAGVELFHDPAGEAWAAVPVSSHVEVFPLRSRPFRSWLADQFYRRTGRPPGSQAVQDALDVLEARAIFGGPARPVYVRVAGLGDRIYLDLADPSWRVVEITPGGWRLVRNPPVYFWRPPGLLPLPEPVKGGSLAELKPFVNAGDSGFCLVVSWLLGVLHPTGPYPILLLTGEQGTGKSTLARLLRSAVDPHEAALRRPPRSEHELFIAAANGWVVGFDNLSTLSGWLGDAFCVLATGGAFSARRLYTDRDEVLLRARRPLVVTTIADDIGEPDFRDRVLRVELRRLDKPVDEGTIHRRFEAVRPRILGALLDAASAALRYWDQAPLEGLARMADFSRWVVASEIAGALPWRPGAFLGAYLDERTALAAAVLDDPVAAAVVALARQGEWRGTATELLTKLNAARGDTGRPWNWPGTPSALSRRLQRLKPELRRAAGIDVESIREPSGRRLLILRPEQNREGPSKPSRVSDTSEPLADAFDGSDVFDAFDSNSKLCSGQNYAPERAAEAVGPADDEVIELEG